MDHDRPLRRAESTFSSGDQLLFRRSWTGDAPQRALVVVHGFAEHSGRYDAMAAWFAERGAAVHAYDQRGHGRTPGRQGHVSRFEDLLDDLDAFLALVRLEHPDVPITIIGHSMGGLVVSAFARERKPERDAVGIVTSGAALELAPQSALRIAFGRIARRLWPTLRTDAGIDVEALSRDPEVGRAYLEDPYVDTHMTVSLGVEFYAAAERTAAGGAAVRIPMLMLHGGSDPLCAASGSERFFETLPRGDLPDSALRVYPELRHEIFNEPERERVYRDVLGWIEAREAAASGRSAVTG